MQLVLFIVLALPANSENQTPSTVYTRVAANQFYQSPTPVVMNPQDNAYLIAKPNEIPTESPVYLSVPTTTLEEVNEPTSTSLVVNKNPTSTALPLSVSPANSPTSLPSNVVSFARTQGPKPSKLRTYEQLKSGSASDPSSANYLVSMIAYSIAILLMVVVVLCCARKRPRNLAVDCKRISKYFSMRSLKKSSRVYRSSGVYTTLGRTNSSTSVTDWGTIYSKRNSEEQKTSDVQQAKTTGSSGTPSSYSPYVTDWNSSSFFGYV